MPIKSYILHFEKQNKKQLLIDLESISNCEIIRAKNHDVIVLVTDTDNEESDKELYNQLIEVQGVKHLSLVSGFDAK